MKTSWNGKGPNTNDRGESLSMNLAKVVSYDNLNLKKKYIYLYKYCRSVNGLLHHERSSYHVGKRQDERRKTTFVTVHLR
jgi:hypothetical protein